MKKKYQPETLQILILMSAYFAEKGGHNEKWRERRKEKDFDYDDEDTFPEEEEEEEEKEEEKEEQQFSYANSARIHSTTTTTTSRTTRERGGRATPSLTSSRYSHHHHHSDSFPRVREILWDASPEKTETTVVWSSDVGPTIFQFSEEEGGGRNLAQRIIEKSKSSSAYLYARYDSGSSSSSNNSSGIVTISSSSSKKSNGSRSNYSCERRVPLDASFRRSKRGSQERKRYGRIASQFAWGSSFTSVRQSFHAKCDAMPSIGNEEEEEMDKDEDQDEPWSPLDMWPMRIGAVVEQFDDVKSEQNSLSWKVHLTVAFEMPSCAFRFAPIRPLRVSREFSTSSRVISALFDDDDDDYRNGNRNSIKKSSSYLSSTTTDATTGFLTLDRARRLCFLKTNSSRVYNSETPLVGVRVHRCDDDARGSDAFLRSSEVWAACLRYASNSVLRKVSQNGSFLVCIVNGKRKVGGCQGKNAFAAAPQLECYDCIATQGKEPFVPHQIDVTLNTNADDLNSADAFVLGVVKEIDRTSIAFKFDRNNDNKVGKEDTEEEGKEEEENDIAAADDDDDGAEIDDIIGYKNFSGKTFQHPSEREHRDGKTTTRKLSEAEKEVASLEALLQNRHRRDDFNGSPFRATSVSTRNFTPRSLAAELVKRAEHSFANNRRGKKIPLREDARGRHRSSSINADKVLRERLRLVQFVVEDQLESGGVAREGGGNSEELVSIRFDNNRSENEHHRDDDHNDNNEYNDNDDDDDSDDADAHILLKYTTSS